MDEEKDVGALEEEVQPPESSGDAAAETPPEEAAETPSEEASEVAGETPPDGDDAAGETPPDGDDESDSAEMAAAVAAEAGADKDGAAKDGEEDPEAAMLAMLEDLPSTGPGATADDIEFGSAAVAGAEFQQLSEPAGQPSERSIDLLKDVNLPISIELGRTKMAISDILSLGPGSVVELNKLAGEPVDLLVNYKIVARGEVVVIDENFGVRITQLLSAEERLRILGEQ